MKNIIYILPFLLLCSACGDDFFSTTLEIDPPEHTEQMVVHAVFSDIDSIMALSLGITAGLLEEIDFTSEGLVDSATVELYRNGTLLSNFTPLEEDFEPLNYGVIREERLGSTEATFELTVKHPDYPDLRAVQQMPRAVVPTEVRYRENAGLFEGDRLNGVEITINDPAGEVNFYELLLYNISNNSSFPISTYSNSPVAEENAEGLGFVISDETFDGKEFKITLLSYSQLDSTTHLVINNITEDLFKYSKSVSDQRESDGFGLFAEPVTISTNVENGLGIFGLRASRFYPLEF
ncbi:MAG: DUF4249 domain-containing protein [Bacteroidota bacterium]